MSRERLIGLLSDGRFHSGNELAAELGVSRGAIWKRIRRLGELGLDVHAVPGQGYRFARALELLEPARVRAAIDERQQAFIETIHIETVTDSTNDVLLRATPPSPGLARVCLAEYQTRGRGRRGRYWHAGFASSLCLSVGYSFSDLPTQLGALSLAMGVEVTRALDDVPNLMLKWPNDIVWQDRKLGGILVEMRGEAAGPGYAVVGLGLNIELPGLLHERLAHESDYPVTDLRAVMQARPISRNAMAGGVISALVHGLGVFVAEGFEPFYASWSARDALRDRDVTLQSGDESLSGRARGLDPSGALLIETDRGVQHFVAGEVSLRRAR